MGNSWRKNNPEKYKEQQTRYNRSQNKKDSGRAYRLRFLYNMSIDDYNNLFNNQDGKCAICRIHQSELKQPLAVDHNHKTGAIRGLLCHSCNLSLGYARENIINLHSMIKYLEER